VGTLQDKHSILSEGFKSFDYQGCDREPIHLLGHIQPHGILLAIKETDQEAKLEIVQISDNTDHFFDIPAHSLINQPLSTLFPQFQVNILVSILSEQANQELEIFNPLNLTVQIQEKEYPFQGVIHRSDGFLILELEPLVQETDSNIGFYHLAKSAAATIRKAKDFTQMSHLLAQQVRKVTQFDHVMIYRFERDNSGIVIAEAKNEHIESFLGLHFPAADIPEIARQLYYKNWLRQIVDVNYQPVPIIPFHNPITQQTIDLSFSTLRSVSPIHIKYLQKMGVSASLSISLLNEGRLWGLIACHHFSPRYINYETRKTCEFLGQIMSVEIVNKHEQEFKQAKEKIKGIQAKLKTNILSINRSNQSINHTFPQDTEELLQLVNAQGAVISLDNHISEIGQCPPQAFISPLIAWLEGKSQDIFYTNCLSQENPEAIAIKDIASGLLAISIPLNHTSYHIIWFRNEVIQTINWAGDPSKLALDDESELSPQRSFELWKENVKAKSLPWSEVEIEAALELRSTLMLVALEFSQQALKKEAERSEVANQAKSGFLARMSHELRTPLNAILGCTQLMSREDDLTEDLGEYVKIISHSGEHLLNLIDDVLEISKIEAEKIILEESRFDFHIFLNNLQDIVQVRAKDKNLQIIFAIHPDVPQYIRADERKIRQILLNLLGNAIKFTNKGYVILRISLVDQDLEDSKLMLHFEVEDTGCGIAPEEINTLFEAFVQTASGRASQSGTGLGLVISQQLAKFMGGYIRASSILTKGTIFQFEIAVEKLCELETNMESNMESRELERDANHKNTADEISLAPLAPLEAKESNSLRILLAEDNAFNQMIALRLLAKLGYQADCAMNGVEVLDAFKTKSYDLILMDVQMPEMDGLEATRQIRVIEKDTGSSNKIKIVAMTANAMQEDREKCLLIGMDDFISKPVRMEDLSLVLKKFA